MRGVVGAVLALLCLCRPAAAQSEAAPPPSRFDVPGPLFSGKLPLTGGVASLEGSAGGGLTPWALIGGQGTRDQIGGYGFATLVRSQDYELRVAGATVGLWDRVELSVAQQAFDTRNVGAALGLGRGFTFHQTVLGAKVRLAGDAVLEQDRWLPQLAVGLQFKDNDRAGVLRAIGARDDTGVDVYASATKLFLAQSLLLSGTVRLTKANELGILGFGGVDDRYEPQFEGSAALLLTRRLAVGAEYRMKPDNLAIVDEDDWADLFLAWSPNKNVTVTLAYARLGTVAIERGQRGLYLSLQLGL
ncbi:MAG TPA: DUF3034 family protein [Azospirillaceae bacterium]|nr:DUF3034 family protein [Azospirillaceae bacterium]